MPKQGTAKPEKPAPTEKVKSEVSEKKIKGPKRNGKAGREFTVMFDIAQKVKAEKAKEEKETKSKWATTKQ